VRPGASGGQAQPHRDRQVVRDRVRAKKVTVTFFSPPVPQSLDLGARMPDPAVQVEGRVLEVERGSVECAIAASAIPARRSPQPTWCSGSRSAPNAAPPQAAAYSAITRADLVPRNSPSAPSAGSTQLAAPFSHPSSSPPASPPTMSPRPTPDRDLPHLNRRSSRTKSPSQPRGAIAPTAFARRSPDRQTTRAAPHRPVVPVWSGRRRMPLTLAFEQSHVGQELATPVRLPLCWVGRMIEQAGSLLLRNVVGWA